MRSNLENEIICLENEIRYLENEIRYLDAFIAECATLTMKALRKMPLLLYIKKKRN